MEQEKKKGGTPMNNRDIRVESYVPTADFYDGKREAAGRAFRDRFAIVDAQNAFSILAFRGEGLQIGKPLLQGQHQLLFLHLQSGERVLNKAENGSALFFGDWMWNGLVPVLLLPDPCADLSAAAKMLFRGEIQPLEEEESKIGKREMSDLCLRFSESLSACDRIFDGQESDLFRRHAAQIAAFAGCRADFSQLSFDPLALSGFDTQKWTILLLCLFLSLRGISGGEPNFSVHELGRETILSGVDFAPSQDAKKQTSERFSFLAHPAFRDVELEATPAGLRFSVVLARRQRPGELQAITPAVRLFFLLEAA